MNLTYITKLILLTSLALFVLVFILLLSIFDEKPLIHSVKELKPSLTHSVKHRVKQLKKNLGSSSSSTEFNFVTNEQEINQLISFVSRGVGRVKGIVYFDGAKLNGKFTFHIVELPVYEYLNATFRVDIADDGVKLSHLSLGIIDVPSWMVLAIWRFILELAMSNQGADKWMSSVIGGSVDNDQLIIRYKAIDGFNQHVKSLREDINYLGDPNVITIYLEGACQLSEVLNGEEVSLGYYLSDAFLLAKKRTLLYGFAEKENQAALLALSIHLGSMSFNSFIGVQDSPLLERCKKNSKPILLSTRSDLRLHFIYSSAIRIITNNDISFAVGEYKELMDSVDGGSGFNYADLAADQAGIELANFALDEVGAEIVQRNAEKFINEDYFFPEIEGLPEQLTSQQFEAQGGVNGHEYMTHLNRIKQRIQSRALYMEIPNRL